MPEKIAAPPQVDFRASKLAAAGKAEAAEVETQEPVAEVEEQEEEVAGAHQEPEGGEEPEPSEAEAAAQEAAEAALNGGKPKKPAAEKKTWKGKIKTKSKGADGKEVDAEEEVEIEEEELANIVSKRRSLDRAAFERFEHASDLEKKAAAREKQLKEDPFSVLRELGHDTIQASIAHLKQLTDFASLPPEQKAQIQLTQEREAFEAEKQQLADQKATQDREVKKTAYREHVLRELPAAMDQRGLVKHPLILNMLNEIGTAQMMTTRAEYPDFNYAAEETEALLREASAAWLDNLAAKNPAALMKALSPAVIKAVKAQALASAMKNPTRIAAPGTSSSAPRTPGKPPRTDPKTQLNPQEWRQRLQAQTARTERRGGG